MRREPINICSSAKRTGLKIKVKSIKVIVTATAGRVRRKEG